MFQKLKRGQIVLHTKTNRKGKVINFEGFNVVVEFIIGQDQETLTRTTKLERIPSTEIRPVENTRKKQYNPFRDVTEFHSKFSHPVATSPQPISPNRAAQRADYLVEELVEFLWASVSGNESKFATLVSDLVESVVKAEAKCNEKGEFPQEEILLHQTDALNDINYINYGSIVETGVNPKPIFEIIQNANMAKLDENGQPILHPVTNKIMKPEGWEENFKPEPLIKAEIERQIELAKKRNGGNQ